MSATADHTPRPATVVVSRRVRNGEARQFRRWLRRLRRQIRRAPEFLDYRVHPPTYHDPTARTDLPPRRQARWTGAALWIV